MMDCVYIWLKENLNNAHRPNLHLLFSPYLPNEDLP